MRESHTRWSHEGTKMERGGVGGREEDEGSIGQEETKKNQEGGGDGKSVILESADFEMGEMEERHMGERGVGELRERTMVKGNASMLNCTNCWHWR